jgi:hypothetical protein
MLLAFPKLKNTKYTIFDDDDGSLNPISLSSCLTTRKLSTETIKIPSLSVKPGNCSAEERVIRPSKELHRFLALWSEAVKGTGEIAKRCQFNELFEGWVFPGYGTGRLSPGEKLWRRVYDGAVYDMTGNVRGNGKLYLLR